MQKLWVGQDTVKFLISFLLAMAVVTLAGCGAGGGGAGTTGVSGVSAGGSTQTITGIAATGSPLASATITIKDSSSPIAKTATGTTATDGSFSVPVTGMTPPFMLVATKTGQLNLYSILPAMSMTTTNSQNVDITPITTLVMYELNGGNDPASMYNSGSFSSVTAANVVQKEALVRGKLPATSGVNATFDMMYGQFAATGASDLTGYDSALDVIGKITSMTSSNVVLTPAVGSATTYTPATSGTSGTVVSGITLTAGAASITADGTTSTAIRD